MVRKTASNLVFVLVLLIALPGSAPTPQVAQADATWNPTGSMHDARIDHTVTLLPNGKLLVAGGSTSFGAGWLASAELYDPATGAWSFTGSMSVTRSQHTATLLPNGKVLVAGGWGTVGQSTSAELYDPASGKWSATGAMINLRRCHTATLLADGRVLVAGGTDKNGEPLASAEIYNPISGTWSSPSDLTSTRLFHTSTLLPNGMVLVAGGWVEGTGGIASAELYNPGTNSWSDTAHTMNTARWQHTATLLPDGKVLVAGGQVNTGTMDSAEVYDPADGTWNSTGSLNTARARHTATLLPDGKVLITGGNTTSAEVYDPSDNAWHTTTSLNTQRTYHTATLLADGRVIAVGGYYSNGGEHFLKSAEIYSYATSAWSNTNPMSVRRDGHTATLLPDGQVLVAGGYYYESGPHYLSSADLYNPGSRGWGATYPMNGARELHTATLLFNGKVLVAGGFIGSGNPYPASAELYNPGTGWSLTGSLNVPRIHHTATLLPDGKVLIAGGWSSSGQYLASAEIYDPAPGSWSETNVMSMPRFDHTATLLTDGRVLVAGGNNASNSAEIYDPRSGNWNPTTGSMTSPRVRHTATLLPNGKVLVAGGYYIDISDHWLASAELYDPMTGFWTAVAPMSIPRADHKATLLPDGRVLVIGGENKDSEIQYLTSAEVYDPASDTWSTGDDLNTPRINHTATLLPDGNVLIAGGYYNDGIEHYLDSAETFDRGLGFDPAWQPVLNTFTTPFRLGSKLLGSGNGFRGFGFIATSGGNTQASDTNYPLVQLMRLDNQQVRWLNLDSSAPFNTTAFTTARAWDIQPGPALATTFVNGIPSQSRVVFILGYRLYLPMVRK